jgi:hypothetical protein
VNKATNLAVPNGTDGNGNPLFLTGPAIFTNRTATESNYRSVIISNNIRGQRPSDATGPLGKFFGEYNGTRDPRVIELAVKLYF